MPRTVEPITTMLDVPCPACAATPVKCLLPSPTGAYCRCDACGHMWHEEGADARTTGGEHPTRRYSDRAGQLPQDEIRALKYRVARLEWEMAALRQSATFFGDLAERLNTQLRTSRQRES